MQIHEITKRSLQEGVFDAFKTPEKIAAQAAQKLQAQGYGQRKPLPSVQDSVAAVQKNPAQQQYIKDLVAQWPQSAPNPTPAVTAPAPSPTGTQPSAPKPGTTPLKSRQPTITTGGEMLTKGEDGIWRDEAGELITNPKDVQELERRFKIQATMAAQNKQMSPASGIKEATSGTLEEIRRPFQQKRRKSTTNANSAPATDPYQAAFEKWAAGKLRTVDPTTRQTITLDKVNSTPEIDIKDELDRALAQVVSTAGDPTKNAVAVNNYLTIAVAGIARVSQQLRQDRVYGAAEEPDKPNTATSAGQAGQAIVTQKEIQNKLSQEVGLSDAQIEQLKKLGQDPAARAALLKSFGVRT
jgi:hypothetical protein